jgi:hypothetical protein
LFGQNSSKARHCSILLNLVDKKAVGLSRCKQARRSQRLTNHLKLFEAKTQESKIVFMVKHTRFVTIVMISKQYKQDKFLTELIF